jgi:hypothetical protein
MLFRLFSFISICVFLIYSPAYSQELSNFREKVLLVESDTLLLDSLSIIPGYLIIEKQNVPIDTSEFQVDYEKSMLIFKKNAPKKDSITIKYRVFPINFTKEYYHKNRKQIEPDQAGIYNPFYYSSSKENKDVFGSGSLSKQGSISRGVSFGNNRDLSVNSNMNLQLSGRVSDNINILAAITDDNIPVQAEGNTQQLQDFDQVYIQLYNDNSRLTAGDFQLKSPNSYYMKYFKKAQGGSFNTIVPVSTNNNSGIMDIQASAAISRGKFSRNIVQGIEGNQGPYRLKGAENETFIIILSGTERVYIDGHLLTRGQENDYIIDYNLAEISFTAKQLITKDKRIIIEFQYSDRNYARSLVQVSDIYKKGKSSVWFNFYSEQDAKNQPLQLDLNEEQRIFLANIGDSLQDALVNKIDSVPFSSDFVLYRMVVPDSLGYDSVFVYSTNPELARYKLVFSNVGEGRGNYRQIKSTANGKVFEWVAPDTINGLIIKRGSFEPVIQLITPKQKQMITLGTETYIAKNTLLKTEFSGTNNDINTFSAKDSKDDLGYAIMINVETKKRIGKESEKPMNLFYGAGYEQLSKNFSYIEWFRSAEFDRDWNLRNRTISGEQYIPSVFLGVEKEQVGKLSYNANSYISENDFTGLQSLLTANISSRGWKINMTGSIMNSEGKQNSSVFMRNKGVVSKSFKRITLGFRDDIEDNRFYIDKKDSLLSNSYKFSEWEFFISNLCSLIYNAAILWQKKTLYSKALWEKALFFLTIWQKTKITFYGEKALTVCSKQTARLQQ